MEEAWAKRYQHLGEFSDLVEMAFRQQSLFPHADPGPETQAKVKEVLGFCSQPEQPLDVRWKNAGRPTVWQVKKSPGGLDTARVRMPMC